MGVSYKILAYTYEYIKNLEDCSIQLTELKNVVCFPKFTGKFPSDEDIARTNEILREIILKTGFSHNGFFCKSDIVFLVDAFSKFQKDSH